MKMITLGRTGINVSELCAGALPVGPVQKNISVEEGSEIFVTCLRGGCNFIDTAQMYHTYPHIRRAMDVTGIKPVISTKSVAANYEDMDEAVQEALSALGIDCIEIFLLHAARATIDVFDQRKGALQCLYDYKAKGVIKAIGVSTHSVDVVESAIKRDDMDVIFPIINSIGLGILNGNAETMEAAIKKALAAEKGVFLMKVLAGGKLISDYENAMSYARKVASEKAAIALGMVNVWEAEMNLRYFNGDDISNDIACLPQNTKRFYIVKSLCSACGECVKTCHSGAVRQDEDGKGEIDDDKCLTCGYCMDTCPSFCIRMI